jgi:hypothetical protein
MDLVRDAQFVGASQMLMFRLPVRRCNTACLAVCRGYDEDVVTSSSNNTARVVQEALGAKEEDICSATPVLDEHFTYFSSVLAGKEDSRVSSDHAYSASHMVFVAPRPCCCHMQHQPLAGSVARAALRMVAAVV